MSTYINNNRGMYGNQNNMYGQQGGYPNSNNYGRQQYQYNYQNNYNAGNYNQNNYQNQNYNNQQNNEFISAYMGRILISSQDLETFKKSIQSPDWTQNKNYLQAENIPVQIRGSLSGQLQSEIVIPQNRINNLGYNSNFDERNFLDFLAEVNNSNESQKKQIENEKNSFMRDNFPNEKPDLSISDLYAKIGDNKKDVIMKDSSLYRKVERLLPLLKTEDAPKVAGNINIKSSGIYDYEKKNDNKAFTNDNYGTPGASAWNSNNNEKKFSNDNRGTPGNY
jgi:hypothetical protein